MSNLDLWRERRKALGRVGARYLYFLLIASLFFLTLHTRFDALTGDGPGTLTLPFVDIDLGATVVWASGPAVIAFFALALLGTWQALNAAHQALVPGAGAADGMLERLNTELTLVDMMFYAPPHARGGRRLLSLLAGPVTVTLALVLSAWLLVSPIWQAFWIPAAWVFRGGGAIVTVACLPRLIRLWLSRVAMWQVPARALGRSLPPANADAPFWRARRDAVSRAQVRYLYLLAIACVFYLALWDQFMPLGVNQPRPITLPVVGVVVSGFRVWAIGPLVVSALVLAILGTLEATETADRALAGGGAESEPTGEELDTEPTVIDLVFYAPRASARAWRLFGLLAYPVVLSLALVLSGWLLASGVWNMIATEVTTPLNPRFWPVMRALGAVMTLACVPRLATIWVAGFKHALR